MAGHVSSGPAGPEGPAKAIPSRLSAFEAAARRRFGAAYLVLALVLGVAAGLFIVFVGTPGKESVDRWSTWPGPSERGQAGASEIAGFVGDRYRLPSSSQLVAVIVTPPEVQDVRISRIAVRSGFSDERLEDIEIYDANRSIFFDLCGLGRQCAIPEGKASNERGLLLRREGLELALYTFKFLPDFDSVVAFIPPQKGKDSRVALYFRRDDLQPLLERPLSATLPARAPHVPGRLDAADAAAVQSLTNRRAFAFQYQPIADGTAIMVLQPVVRA